jgi:hypothetical protein
MTLELFTIYDTKSETYFQPFYMLNTAMALRQFADMANDKESNISKHPEDYTLYHLGSWQDQDAKFETIDKKLIASANENVISFTKTKPTE